MSTLEVEPVMRAYERARDELGARLHALEGLLGEENRAALHQARSRLVRGKFVLAVVGEFSSGKSFLLNKLLGKPDLLAVDINPSTAAITELEYGIPEEAYAVYEDGRRERVPLDALDRFVAAESAADTPVRVTVKTDSPFLAHGFAVADTPGLASVNPAHRRATLAFLPSADAVLYLIDTQQPFTQGDASFLGIVRRHIDSIFIIQTKIDLWGQVQPDGRAAWEHAYDRIARMAAVHAPGTLVFALSARTGDRFSLFLERLDASLVERTGRARLRRAYEAAEAAIEDELSLVERQLALHELDEAALRRAKAASLPELQAVSERANEQSLALRNAATARILALQARGEAFAAELERTLVQAFDTADVTRLRDRERLHLLVDRVVAAAASEFGREAAQAVVQDVDAALERARTLGTLRWSPQDAFARAFGQQAGTSLWSGDLAAAIATTTVLEAIGGPAISLVGDVASRFAAKPAGAYMKRELVADLRSEILPRLRAELRFYAAHVATCLGRPYEELAEAVARIALTRRDAELAGIERALRAYEGGCVASAMQALRARRAAIEAEWKTIRRIIEPWALRDEAPAIAGPGPESVRLAHAEPAFDRDAYDRGLRPQRWRVAVLGALRRGKSSLINAFARRRVLTDDAAGSARFPIHVRYGEREQAFALGSNGEWGEIPYETASAAAALTPVLVLVPWDLPRELVLVHAPAFDSGDPDAEDVNVVVASHASETLCLFSRQLCDRELDVYERIAESGRPMLFAHTLADNEEPAQRRGVVELARAYLEQRHVTPERIFTVSAREYDAARRSGRAPAGWNETEALRATLESHAESHMSRLVRKTTLLPATPKPTPRKTGLLARIFGKGH